MPFAPLEISGGDRQPIVGVTRLATIVFSRVAAAVHARWNAIPTFWRAQILGWGLFALVDLVSVRLLVHDFSAAFRRTVLVVACLGLLSTAMRWIYASPAFGNRLTARAVAWITVLSVGGGALIAALVFSLRGVADLALPGRNTVEAVLFPLTHYSIMLAGWSICYFWIHAEAAQQTEHSRALRAEADALRAELQELRLQLDPHFLFNALNGVAEEIPDHPTAALAMLRDLTAYLRHSLEGINRTVVTVEAEVSGLSAYLRVQQARFGDGLKTRLHTDFAATSRHIASFLLQPLVENAVKYSQRDKGFDIGIDIRLVGDALHIAIENTGSLDSARRSRQRRTGVGLENVRRRLALHYPRRHQFTLTDSGGTENKVVAKLILEGEPCES